MTISQTLHAPRARVRARRCFKFFDRNFSVTRRGGWSEGAGTAHLQLRQGRCLTHARPIGNAITIPTLDHVNVDMIFMLAVGAGSEHSAEAGAGRQP